MLQSSPNPDCSKLYKDKTIKFKTNLYRLKVISFLQILSIFFKVAQVQIKIVKYLFRTLRKTIVASRKQQEAK